MAYDAQSDRIILVGGRSGSQSDGETWSFDANHDAWVNLNPASHPPARSGQGIAYNARADRMILFGGSSCCTPVVWFGDTWSYDRGAAGGTPEQEDRKSTRLNSSH